VKPKPKVPVFWIALGAVLAIAIVAVVITAATKDDDSSKGSGSGGSASTAEFGTVTVEGQALPELGTGGEDSAVGDTIPTVEGENFEGEPVTISPGGGNAQMIVFLAHWCPHCNAEAPRLAEYLGDSGGTPAGTEVTLVATGSRADAPNWPPSEWIDEMGLAGVRTLVDDEQASAARAFGLSGFPFIVMVDADGQVVGRLSGEQSDGFFADAFDALAAGEDPLGG
jgi:thiol-disulfide isomerase/thioredoxin